MIIFQIVFDDPNILNHEKTTTEIKECAKDIKVLGRKDLRYLLNWRKALHEELVQNKNELKEDELTAQTQTKEKEEPNDESIEDNDLHMVDQQIAELQEEEYRDQKRKKKKVLKERKKLNERLNLKMVLKNDDGPTMEGDDMFSLKQVKDNKKMNKIIDQTPDVVAESDEDEGLKHVPKYTRYEKGTGRLDSSGTYYKDSDSELEMESDGENEDNIEPGLGKSVDVSILFIYLFNI